MGMPPIVLTVPLFTDELNREASEQIILRILEGYCRANQIILRYHPEIPPLYRSGVFYAEPGKPEWQDILTTIRRGKGDCKDLGAWRVAELRQVCHIMAMPHVTWKRVPGSTDYSFHVLVRFPNGRLEDPSRYLGMGSEPGSKEPYYKGD
jgi:hypothetical protein